ncbi:MAG: hypothetical protein U0572_11965 [Phycisphaerales bacterium]
MHALERGGVVIVVSRAVQESVDRVQEQFPIDIVPELARAPRRLVDADRDVDVDRFRRHGAGEGQDVGRLVNPHVPRVQRRHLAIVDDADVDPRDRRAQRRHRSGQATAKARDVDGAAERRSAGHRDIRAANCLVVAHASASDPRRDRPVVAPARRAAKDASARRAIAILAVAEKLARA